MKNLLIALLLLAAAGCSRAPARVRVQNNTERALSVVMVESISFGAIAAGGSSGYQEVPTFKPNPTVQTQEPNGYFRNHHVIQDPQGAVSGGSFTIALSLDPEDCLAIQLHPEK